MPKEKPHRLSKELYIGQISAAFTLCLKDRVQGFIHSDLANSFIVILSSVVSEKGCIVPVYCFMPDHQHIIITGKNHDADVLKAVVSYKHRTGYFMSKNKLNIQWQKDYYDHIIRNDENLAVQIKYILDNPVRKGLVQSWKEYPFKGSIGCRLEDVLEVII
ncbi:MAG: transposase [Proteobacteria bacterium]|nr:transposase [Pseudomonadota bacterium]